MLFASYKKKRSLLRRLLLLFHYKYFLDDFISFFYLNVLKYFMLIKVRLNRFEWPWSKIHRGRFFRARYRKSHAEIIIYEPV